MRVAIDVGGTFTDVLLYDEHDGALRSAKVPSDPWHPADPFMEGLGRVLKAARADLEQVSGLVHGTTIVTNALLEGKTAKVGLLVTEGFRDLLEIGRQQRPELYDLMKDRRPPLVPRDRVREIRERIGADGRVVVPLDEEGVGVQIKTLGEAGIESLAVVLLFSFRNPDHEARLGDLVCQLLPGTFVFLSSQVLPEFREFERASTTVIAAAVAPKVVSYLQAIEQDLKAHNWDHDGLAIMHSGGGTLPSQQAVSRPHTLVESGPAAGLIAAGHLAQTLGLERVIAFDMGGTTAKAGLVLDGSPQYTAEYEVGGDLHHGGRVRGSGYPVRFPMIDVAECGAGAGSIAWIDPGGHLKVGPHSAGADPGPACYGKGGTEPTVTDAHLILGRLAPDFFLGGEMMLQPTLAERAIVERICDPMDMNLEEAAQGIIAIANANMLRILRVVTVARGHDPRDFTLVAYGGAGPLHATNLAEEMSIGRVIVPQLPGLFSALGLLYADMTTDFVETVMTPLTLEELDRLKATLARMKAKAEAWFERTDVPPEARSIRVSADLRYLRQNYELNVALPGPHLSPDDVSPLWTRFHDAHAAAYGHGAPGETIQVVNLRLLAVKRLAKPEPRPMEAASRPADVALRGSQSVWFPAGPLQCNVFERSALRAGHIVNGPAIIQEKEATTLVGPGWHLQVDGFGNLMIEK